MTAKRMMHLKVRGSFQEAMNAAIKRDVIFVPQEQLWDGTCTGVCPMSDADKVLSWFQENGSGGLFQFTWRVGSLLGYDWPEEN